MPSKVDERIQRNPSLASAVSRAENILRDVLGASADHVSAEWSLSDDERGRPVIGLRLRDFTGAVESRFTPDELENATHLQIRLHRLWGDLLQDRSHRQVSKLKELVRSLDE